MKNTGSKLFSLLLGSGMMLATTLPAHALSKSDINHAATFTPTGQKSTVIAQAAFSPVQGAQKNEVVKKGYMETSFNLDSNGNLNAKTKTWTDVRLKGFTGGVLIAFTDLNGAVIWSTEQQQYGVDGTWVGKSSRTENWPAKVPPETLGKIVGYAILQEPTPRGRALDWLRSSEGQATIKSFVKIFSKN